MAERIALLSTLFLYLVLLPGCPGATGMFVGTWVLTIGITEYGLEVLPIGEATSFMIGSSLGGILMWFGDGSQFIMNQNNSGASLVYSGNLSMNGESMAGARVIWSGQNQGTGSTWTAVRM